MTTKTDLIAGALALAVMTGHGGPALAQLSQAWTWCANTEKASPDIQIGGCTSVIQSGKDSKTFLAAAYINRGSAYDDKKQYDRAIQDYDQAIKLNPNLAAAFNNRGVAYRNKGQHDRAIQDFNQAIKLSQKHAGAFHNRGLAYQYKGQHNRAIQDFDQAIKLIPKNWLYLRNRADALYLAGKYDRAIADYDITRQLNPKLADGLYGRGLAKLKKGDSVGGNADIAAAKAIESNVAEKFAKSGVK